MHISRRNASILSFDGLVRLSAGLTIVPVVPWQGASPSASYTWVYGLTPVRIIVKTLIGLYRHAFSVRNFQMLLNKQVT